MSALALQQAVFAALAADSGVAALVGGRIHDEVPRNGVFPYLVLGEAEMRDWSTKTDTGAALVFPVTVWSRTPGFAEAKRIAAAVQAALAGAALTLAGAKLVDLAFQGASFARARDGVTRSATLKFRALLEFTED